MQLRLESDELGRRRPAVGRAEKQAQRPVLRKAPNISNPTSTPSPTSVQVLASCWVYPHQHPSFQK